MRSFQIFTVGFLLQFAALAEQLPQVAVASSLQFAMVEIVDAFEQQYGVKPRMTYGSSGNFRRQIEQGAPFQLFLSADESYISALSRSGLTIGDGHIYALGRLALIVPEDSQLALNADLSGISAVINNNQLQRFAIANPIHAPYGRAARESLQTAGLWQNIQPFLITGENASQATQFALSGSSQGGLVAYALALAPQLANISRVKLVDQKFYQPLHQRMVLLKGAGEIARRFYDFILSAESQVILKRYGFGVVAEVKI